jgi:hypothetical protein
VKVSDKGDGVVGVVYETVSEGQFFVFPTGLFSPISPSFLLPLFPVTIKIIINDSQLLLIITTDEA